MHIGLVGGIGPAATDYYYREIIQAAARGGFTLELTMAHADSPVLLDNLARGDTAAQVAVFARLTERLQAAGARTVAITSIAGHFCIEAFKAVSPLPVIDMIEEVNRAFRGLGFGRVGILGTKTVMETRFYGGIDSAEVVPPAGSDLDAVHRAYVEMAAAGRVTEAQRETFLSASRRMIAEAGAEAVMLGGTDLVLAFDGRDVGFEVVDCAKLHIDAIAQRAAVPG